MHPKVNDLYNMDKARGDGGADAMVLVFTGGHEGCGGFFDADESASAGNKCVTQKC